MHSGNHRIGEGQWGRYITEIERTAVLHGQSLAGGSGDALDFGSGRGDWSEVLSQLGWNMICIDASPRSLKTCADRLPKAECILTDENRKEIPTRTARVQMVICLEVPSVIASKWFTAECHRVLQPNGIFVGVFLNAFSLRGLFKMLKGYLGKGESDYHRSYRAWRGDLTQAGFKILQNGGYCWFPLRRSSNSSLTGVFVLMEKWLGLRRIVSLSPWIWFIAQRVPRAGMGSEQTDNM